MTKTISAAASVAALVALLSAAVCIVAMLTAAIGGDRDGAIGASLLAEVLGLIGAAFLVLTMMLDTLGTKR